MRLVERRIQQLDERMVPPNEVADPPRPWPCASVRHRPPLRAQTSFVESNRSGIRHCSRTPAASRHRSRRGDTILPSQPCCSIFSRSSRRLRLAALGEDRSSSHACHFRELHENVIQEKSQPDTFASALSADHVHPVVPVTGADERQAVLPACEAVQDGSHTMVVQTGRSVRSAGQIVIRVFLRVDRPAFDEVDRFIQHPGVTRAQDIAACCQGQPEKSSEQRVRTPRPDGGCHQCCTSPS